MKLSIELCDMDGVEASTVINDKIFDPRLPISIGTRAIEHIVGIKHEGHGIVVVEYSDADGTPRAFAYPTSHQMLRDSAASFPDGAPICIDC